MNKFMKITSVIFALFLIMSVSVTAFATAEDTTPDSDGLIVNDMADILTDDEEIEIKLLNPKAPCFIKDEEENYIYLILPVTFSAVN